MNVALLPSAGIEEFLAWERQQELRYEWDGFRAIPMNGGTYAHTAIASALFLAMHSALTPDGFKVIRADLKVIVAGRVRYPDLVVTRSAIDWTSDIVPDPVVVVEVLSDSTARIDRVDKKREYAATPSILHYVVLDQAGAAEVWSRDGDDWTGCVIGLGDDLVLPALGFSVKLDTLYADLPRRDGQQAP